MPGLQWVWDFHGLYIQADIQPDFRKKLVHSSASHSCFAQQINLHIVMQKNIHINK